MNKFELTNPQKSIWVTEEFYKGTSIENIAGTTLIKDKVDFEKLKKAINMFVKNNDGFRLKFVNENNSIKQYIADYEELLLDVKALESEKDVKKIEKDFANTPFKLFDSFLFRFQIYSYKDGRGGFVVVGHHLIVDAWACGLVISEIMDNYNALVQNIEPPTVDCSYLDYIKSEQDYLSSEKFKKDQAFWMEKFNLVPDPVTLPGSLSSKEILSQAKRKIFKIPAETMDFVNSFCKENKISPFNFFMGVYSIYLSRVNNVDEFVLGTPILNRSNAKEKHTIGMFISVVPFKVSIPNNQSFVEFTKTISSDFFDIFRHQKYPYQKLLEDLRKQNTNLPNLYNVMLSYQNMRTNTKTSTTEHETKWLFNNNISDDIEIHFFDINDNGVINVAYDYKTSKYTADDIYAHHSRILHIINQILENNNILLKNIDIVTPDEKNEILYKFNNTAADYPKDKTIVQLFEEQVEKTPDNTAVVFEDQSLTYKELNEKANSLANYLRNNGVVRNDVIALRIEKSLEMIVSIIGIIKAGACYLPINLSYPQDRVNFMLTDANAKFLLTNKKIEDEIKTDVKKILIDLNNNKIYTKNTNNLDIINKPEDLIYIIYTSGSTGTPKGAMIMHKNVVRLMKNDKFLFDFNDKDVWTLFHSVAFDFSVWEMYGALLYGGKLVIVSDNVSKDPNLFLELMDTEGVTVLNQTPTYFYNLLNTEIKNPHPTLKIRYIVFGGEALKPNLIAPWKKMHPKTKLINMYGITETTVHVTFKELSDKDLSNGTSNIGIPIPTLQVFLLDRNLKLVPHGVPGEICVCGDGVFKGYLNRPDLNKTKLIPNPYNKNEIMYRSADSAILNNDNCLEYIGRIDTQVKIRGFRVELGEIEEKILAYSNINSCKVTTKRGNSMHDLLCAYYISTAPIDINKLRKSLQKDLPSYMIPQYFIPVDEWPYNHNGKIDTKKLPMPEIKVENKEIILPRNEIDSKLINIFKELLNVNSISIDDNFFELGGDSLSAINLCTQIQSELNAQIFVKDILENPIIKDLSDIVTNNINNSRKETITSIKAADYYPVSSAQKRMYFASQVAGDNSILYNIPGGIILDGNIDIKKLEDSFKILINRHESLRTFFELIDGNVVQKVIDRIDFKLDIFDNANFNKLDSLFKDFVKPFDLSKVPLFRAKLIKFNNQKSALFVDMHHIISDGTSLNILVDELCKIYDGKELPQLNITYKDYSVFENNRLSSSSMKEAEEFWLRQFQGEIPVLNLHTKYHRPAMQSFEGAKEYFSIDLETTDKINTISKNLGTTPYMLLLACYYILLSKYTAQSDIVIGTPIVGRDIPETQNLIGMFVNSLAIKERINSQISFRDLLLKIKDDLLNSYKYQTYPFDELVNKLGIKRDTSRNPLFDTMFIYQNNGFKDVTFNGIQAKYYIPDTHISKFDLSLEVIPNENGANLSFEYATKLFDDEFIKHLSTHYLNILNCILDDINISISDICMLSEAEKDKILREFNDTKQDFPKDKTIIELFEKQAEETPDKIAIVFEDKTLTYKELNDKANSLANYLKDNDISKNDVIGVRVSRSLELIISIIAVLKSDAIYTLIDTALPDARVDYILKNCKAKLLLVDTMYDIKNIESINVTSIDYSKNNKNFQHLSESKDDFTIIYTSGSTGNPKGVLLHNKGFVNLVYSFKDVLDLASSKKHLGFAAVSFDMFAVELFSSILLGRTLYLLNDEEMKNPVLISNIIIKNNIDYIICTPTKIELLLANENTSECLKKLKGMQLGGEVFTPDLYKRISSITTAKINNGYGPTEITACCSNKLVTSEDDINIGSPIANTKIYILDKNSKLCPINVPGELCVAGVGVSHGYIYDDKKTSKAFVQSDFSNELLYKTGDIALYNSNGELEYIGRNDFQVKINGLRIELSEIEKKLNSIPDIKSCVVITDRNKTYVKAFFTSDATLSIPSIRKKLAETLPQYMIPKMIMQIDSIPMTNNGKVDRKILDDLTSFSSNEEIKYVAPENELQQKFCNIWENILGTKVGIDNDLFELGADSLTAIRFKVDALNEGIDIPYADIFRLKTIRNLSESKTQEIVTTPIENFEYTEIDKILKKNKTQLNYKFNINKNNNVLLFGSNGFVGMHIIDSFIKNDSGTIYCLMRDRNGKGALNRFLEVLHFYFGTSLDNYIGNRIIVLKGDILKDEFGLSQRNYAKVIEDTSIVINTAANVKHFGDFNKFKNINIDSIKRTIDFCSKYSKKLIHISTLSVSGNMFLDNTISKEKLTKDKKIYFSEKNLFINQSLDNVYTRSKFEAEKIVLDNIAKGKLDGLILRLGNITSRYSDGRFQINPEDNAFTSRLQSFVALGVIPKSILHKEIEFTPVDLCANAIIKCMQYNHKPTSVLHIYDRNHIKISSILSVLKDFNMNINVLSDNDFSDYINNSLSNKDTKKYINGIINDLDIERKLTYDNNIYIKSDFSVQYLLHCKFRWVKINKEYIIKYITYLKSIGFFNN